MNKYKIIDVCALFLLMLITGVFWGTWFTLTRSLETFSAEEFIHIGQTIIANVAMPMRIIMPSGVLMMALSLRNAGNKQTASFIYGIVSLVLIIGVLLITLLVLVPIDKVIREGSVSTIPADWDSIRKPWDLFHSIRTFASLASFVCFSIYLLTQPENRNSKQGY